ncbi:MAG: hypothetical protein ACR2PB_09820 [Desulfocapsaceae bacterium]
MKKLRLLLLGKDNTALADLEQALIDSGQIKVTRMSSPEQVYQTIAGSQIDAVVADEEIEGGSGLEFIRDLVRNNPFINCALVSSLYPDEFHEATEGYGVFMQLPVRPGKQEAREICSHLNKIC